MAEYGFDITTPCTFKGLFGNTENGNKLALVGLASAFDASGGPLFGATFSVGKTATGCFSLTTGDFSMAETDTFTDGTGGNRNATGSATYTAVGVTLGAPTAPGYGSFSWFRVKGTFVEAVP